MKKIILLFGLLVTCWQINAQDYCTDGGPSSTFDTNVESVDLVGETATIAYLGCQNVGNGVAGVEDLTDSQSADVIAGNSYTVDVQFGTCGGNYSSVGEAWIDFDRDGFFETTESIGTIAGIAPFTLQSFAVTVPSDAINGSSRMRVMQWEGGVLPLDPCGSFTYGSVVDFEIVISGGIDITCEQPFNVQLVEVFGSSADFSWDLAPNDQNGYIWEVFNAGADPDVDTPVSTGTVGSGVSTVNADGLTELTDYDFYVITDCGATDGLSQRSNVVTFTTVFLCPAPSNVTVDGVTASTFNISWNEIPNARNGYTWSVFNAGDDPTIDTPVFTGTEPFGTTSTSVTGLTDNTSYDVYVSADCDVDGTSELSNVVTVTTPCTALSAPITENFDGASWVSGTGFNNTGDAIDNCWQRTPGQGTDFFWGTRSGTTGSTGTGPSVANSTPNYIFTEGSNGSVGDEAFFVSPLIDLSPLTAPALTFWYHMFGDNMGTLSVDVDAGSGFDLDVFTISGQQQVAESDAFIEQIVDLSAYAGQTVTIRFRGVKGDGFESDIAIDDFKVDEAPSCLKTFNLALVEAFDVEAEVSWSLIGNATNGYIWEVYNAGDDPTTATPVSTGTFVAGITSGLLTGLTELTDYDLYIISDCGVDGTSDLAGPLSFSTLATCPSPSNIAVTNITENSADITWDESFNASNGYNWELFLDGEDPATATPTQSGNVAFGTTTLNLTGLSDNVDYDFYITSDCDTDGLSVTEGPISFLTLPLPPVNDDICDAIPLTVGVIPPSDTYTNLGATAQTDEPEGTCFNGGLNGSVWFTFVAPASGEVEVSTDIAGATLTDTEIAVYDAPTDCADPTTMGAELGCDQDGGTVIGFNSIVNLSGLTGGTTYYIQVDQWGTTTPGDFGISVIDTNPPCPVPENITLNSVSNTTADFSWDDVTEATDGYNWFVFNQGADVTTDSPVATGNVGVGVLNASASGLTSNTVYDFYVQSDCGSTNGISALGNPLTFTTDCDSFTAPYFNDFEAFPVTTNLTVEDCWNEVSLGSFTWDVGTGGTGSLNTGPSGALSGNNYVFTEASSGSQGDEAILLSPSLDLSTLAEPTLSFWYHMYGADIGTLAVDVKTSTSANFDLDVFTLSGEQQTAETDSWIQQFVDLTTYAGETIQFRFRVIRGNGFAGDVAIEDVLIDEAPSCFTPTGLSVDSVGNDSVNVSWDDTPSAIDGYEILVFADGDDPDTDTPFATANEPAGVTSTTITGLTGLTTYQVYILSDCGAVDGQSLLSNGITFTTLCDPFVAPFVEDFNTNGTNIPSCWEQAGNTSKDWLFTDPPSFSHVGDSGTLGGSTASNGGLAWVDDSSPNVLDTRLHSPLIDVSSLSVPFLSFYLISNNEGFSNVDFRVEVWDGATWNEVFFSNSNTFNGEWEEIQIELSTLTFTGNAQIAFIVDENNGTDFYDDVAIDDVRLEEAPACPKPGNIAIIDVFFDSLEVSWNSVSNASNGYIWEVYNAGDDPAVDTPVSTGTFASGTTQGVADGLLPETDYDFYMISDCGATDGQSVLTNPITFTTTELCSLPSTFEVTNVLPDSAELTWTPIPNAINGYLWAIFNAGDDPATATPVVSGTAASGDTSVIATGLTDNSDYEAYITTDCGPSDGQSIQSQPVAFSTHYTVFTAPYFNDFEAFPVTTNLTEEDCWIEDSSGSFGWDVGTGGTGSLNTGPSGALSGNNYVFTEASSGTQGDEAILLSPLVDLSTLTQPALSFWYHMYGADISILAVDVKISTSANFDLDVFTLSGEQQTAETDSWIQQFVDLSIYAGETIQFRFRVTRGNGFTGDVAIEDVLIDEAPSCLTPTGLTVSNITETTADLSWSVIGNATSGYNWFVFNAGDDPDVDTPVASGSTAKQV
ncbi:fibronectin type III domain-containing protein [Flavobacterium sp. CS20]|uniref:fibronectin type III domain-containing protein n=1 Tax=Flavobacterium sp. CS20 TaxID=2775246 RepID=UPI001B39E719|nr:fibronectin type III domain-containing protein [Flavobacterium sp. CS20]QTY27996.1 fibronectin type III domain-containing protein [Flavobacterium sp. CS20]